MNATVKNTIVAALAAFTVASVAEAAKTNTKNRKTQAAAIASDESPTTGRAAKVNIVQEPRLGAAACLNAPSVNGASNVGQCYKKPRQWIVLETKYDTFGTETSRFLDQLTFTWHVLLDASTAKENKGNRAGVTPYSYFNTTVTYFNIPAGSHAASVVLPPSYLELYGEPKAIGLEITNQNGEFLNGDAWSEVKGIKPHTKFWEDNDIMNAKTKDGKPMIDRRQGLVDRSKTIWAMVNPNDYEATVQ